MELWNVFDNWDNSVKVISLKEVNDLLAEELSKSDITFFSEFGIFFKVFSHLDGQQVNQVFGSCVLHWNFNNFFVEFSNSGNTIDVCDFNSFTVKELVKGTFVLESDSTASDWVELILNESTKGWELVS